MGKSAEACDEETPDWAERGLAKPKPQKKVTSSQRVVEYLQVAKLFRLVIK